MACVHIRNIFPNFPYNSLPDKEVFLSAVSAETERNRKKQKPKGLKLNYLYVIMTA